MELTPDSTVRIAPEVWSCELDGEAVVLDLRAGTYYGLDEVGAMVWALLEAHSSLGAVHAALLRAYDVAPERAWADLVRLVGDLVGEGLAVIDGAPEE